MTGGTICFTVDVEDWFQAENLRSAHPPDTWGDRESRVEASTRRIMDVFAEAGISATFFVLGWVADRAPGLVRAISEAGHEVASHGQGHIINYALSEADLRQDVTVSKKTLEDITGSAVLGYRAPCFSVSDRLLEILFETGYSYDSSLNPFSIHDRYGRISGRPPSSGVFTHQSGMMEVPMTMESFMGMGLPVSGGGYFRLYPYRFFERLVRKHLERTGLYVFYMHPWEVDPDQPRTVIRNPGHRFRHYYGLSGTLGKLGRLTALQGDKKTLSQLLMSSAATPPA